MNREQLNKILENHKHWLIGDCEGWEDMRADLSRVDLSGANLYGVDLYHADLSGANLCDTDLRGVNLRGANLYRTNLCGAHLHDADLRGANLVGAILCEANLCRANLYGANLWGADLRGASLGEAILCEATLCEVDLCKADLRGADLRGADLRGAKNIPFIPMVCPEEGAFIGYKKADNLIVKLEICKDARRSSVTDRKCRCDKAKVLSITNIDGSPTTETEVSSDYDENFIYRVGEIAEEPNFCEDRFEECASGIHFFINRQEAIEY